MRRLGAVLLVAALGAAEEERRLSPAQEAQLERLAGEVKTLVALAGVQASDLARLDPWLSEFDTDELARFTRNDALGRVLRAVAFRRVHGARLRQGDRIAFGLASHEPADVRAGVVALHKEPFGRGLEEVAAVLVDDPRADVRRGAGSLAKYLTLIRGPRDACDAIAVKLAKDRDPELAGQFVVDAYDFGRPKVLEAVMRALRDARRIPGYDETVGTCARRGLGASWAPAWRSPKPDRRAYPQRYDYRTVRKWWRDVRETWSFGPDPDRWKILLRHRGELADQPARIGAYWVRVEYADAGHCGLGPQFTARYVVSRDRAGRDLVASGGNNNHHFGWVMKSSGGPTVFSRAAAMPDWRGRMRVWLEVWGPKGAP